MFVLLLEKARRLFKSLGKYEFDLIDKIILTKNKSIKKNRNIILNEPSFKKINKYSKNSSNNSKRLAIVICFHYKLKKIKKLITVCSNISKYNFNYHITIITNNITKSQKKILIKKIKTKIKKISIIEIKNSPEPNLLPWYSLNVMKERYKIKSFTHFLYLEDDILVSSKNINYWIYCRKILKKYNLIPGFIRYELYKKNLFSTDNPKKIKIKKMPNIISNCEKFGFVNLKYPYHAMYLMDRQLMHEYLKSSSATVDFGFHNRIMKNLYPIKELTNISIAYNKLPEGFHSRYMIPFIESNKIPDYCLVKHLNNKYVKRQNSNYGKIKIQNLLI